MATRDEVRFRIVGKDDSASAIGSAVRRLDGFQRSVSAASRLLAAAFAVREVGRFASAIADATIKLERYERGLRVATGSAEGATREMAFVREEVERLGLNLETAAEQYTKIAAAAKGTVLAGEDTRDIFVAISEAARVLGLSSDQTSGALVAIEQIISKGKVSAEELRQQLGERLPGAFQIAARSIGVTTAKLDDMLKKGQLTAEQLLPAMARELHRTFGPEVEAAATDAEAAFSRFSTAVFELKAAIGESGVIDLLADLARAGTAVARGFGNAPIDQLRGRIAQLQQQLQAGYQPLLFGTSLEDAGRELEKLQRQLRELQGFRTPHVALDALLDTDSPDGLRAIQVAAEKIATATAKDLESELVKKLKVVRPDIEVTPHINLDDPTLGTNILPKGIPLLVNPTIKLDPIYKEVNQLKVVGQSAAEAIGSTFENVLAGAFAGVGLEWDQLLRAMIAKVASSALLSGIFAPFASGTGFLGQVARAILPGFATGGSFTVGGGGGLDKEVVAFRATRGEQVTVSPSGPSEPAPTVIVNIQTGLPQQVRAELELIGREAGMIGGHLAMRHRYRPGMA